MKLSFSLYLSAASLRNRKFRSVLTIGGMAVGVSLIVFLVSLGFGLQRLIRSQITDAEALTVLEVSKGESTLLELNKDAINSFENIDNVKNVSASISLSGQLARGESSTDVAIYGVNPQTLDIEGVKLTIGGGFSDQKASEVLITTTALNLVNLEADNEALGEEVSIDVLVPVSDETGQENLEQTTLKAKIAGIVQDEELTLVYMPLEYLESVGFPAQYTEAKVKVGKKTDENVEFDKAKVKVTDQSKLPEVRKQIEKMGYQVNSIADTVGQIDKIFLIFQLVVGGFGAIAMFVAAIGALNTLTVSLLERTREIGLMKSFGATSGDIYRLFLSEAVLIGLSGGIVGIIFGLLTGLGVNTGMRYLANRLGGDPVDIFYTPVVFIFIMVGIVILINLVTGLYPSRRAAVISALDALRYE